MKSLMSVSKKERKKGEKAKLYRTQRFSIQLKEKVLKIFSKLVFKLNEQEQSFLLDLARQSLVKQLTISTPISSIYISLHRQVLQKFHQEQVALEEISITSRYLSIGGFILFCAFQWPSLQKITLCTPTIDARYCRELTLANWPRLKQFTIFHYPQRNSHTIGNDGLEVLLTCDWRWLTKLHLDTVGLANATQGIFLMPYGEICRHLSQVLVFHAENNQLSRRAIQEIVRSNFGQLSEVNLQKCHLDDACLSQLSKGKWIFLTFLQLMNNWFTNKGVRMLAQGDWGKLRLLKLNYDIYNLESVRIVAKSICKRITFPCEQTPTLCIRFKIQELFP